ncbi:MAG: DUF1287 domain-containing protein [Oscillospiraceae bacterium]
MEKRYSGRRRRHLRWLWLLMIPVLAAGYTLWRFGPQRSYTARQLGLTDLQSPNDADGDGVDDWTDVVLGARTYIATDPHYQSKYYAGGYPDDGLGVCTDVIWQALQAAGYDLKALVDADIAACPEAYPHITTPDSNIDFRRVNTLDTFFRRHAQVLTCDLSDGQQWQPGDIVVFGDRAHIGLCSDRRNRQGIPFLIHHGNPIDEAVERNDIPRMTVTGHFRWLG